jgi:hypothetical protein
MARDKFDHPNLLTQAKIRGGREGNRPSEDDISKHSLGQQGIPGQEDKPELDQDELQNPTALDPGHTA